MNEYFIDLLGAMAMPFLHSGIFWIMMISNNEDMCDKLGIGNEGPFISILEYCFDRPRISFLIYLVLFVMSVGLSHLGGRVIDLPAFLSGMFIALTPPLIAYAICLEVFDEQFKLRKILKMAGYSILV